MNFMGDTRSEPKNLFRLAQTSYLFLELQAIMAVFRTSVPQSKPTTQTMPSIQFIAWLQLSPKRRMPPQ
jgi:hypothetical protein